MTNEEIMNQLNGMQRQIDQIRNQAQPIATEAQALNRNNH